MTRSVAILGAGIGAQHLEGYRALAGRFEVAALCDRDADRASGVVQAAGHGARVVDDVAAVLADPGIEVVDICLPPHLHFPVARAALQAGKHVICEKPLVRSLAEADDLAALAAAAGRQVFPVFQYRYGPGLDAVRALIAAGLAGAPQVASLETHWNRDGGYYAVPWRGTWAGEAGGCVLGHAIHAHDILTSLFGPAAEVSAATATRVNPIETEDCAAIRITHATGALATSSVTLGAASDTSRLRLVFAGLTAESAAEPYAPAEGAWTFTARAPVTQAQVEAVLAGLPRRPAGFAGYFAAVADALDGRPGREVTLACGRASIELVSAIYQSARSGQAVPLPLARGSAVYRGWLPQAAAEGTGGQTADHSLIQREEHG